MRKYLLILSVSLVTYSCHHKPGRNFAKEDSVSAMRNMMKDVSPKNLIVPGKGIGKIKIGGNSGQVFNLLGKPDLGDAAMGKALSTWYQGHDKSGFQTQVFFSRQMGTADDTSRVKQIRITSPVFETADQIHVNTLFSDISAKFKLDKIASYKEKGKTFSVYAAISEGIAFEVGSDQKCSGILIFEPGRPLSYFPFHTNMQLMKNKKVLQK